MVAPVLRALRAGIRSFKKGQPSHHHRRLFLSNCS
jgi:hypothetical protein